MNPAPFTQSGWESGLPRCKNELFPILSGWVNFERGVLEEIILVGFLFTLTLIQLDICMDGFMFTTSSHHSFSIMRL